MTDVLIKRELLEQVASEFEHDNDRYMLGRELRKALDAPRQPEGDAISLERVQAEAEAFFDWPTAEKSSVTTKSCLIFARCIAGMVAAERDAAVAKLREECEHLKDCQENAMLHMTGLVSERNTLRQQLAEARDEITQHSNDLALAYMKGGADMRQQRDRLAELLRMVRQDGWYHPLEEHEIAQIEAAMPDLK